MENDRKNSKANAKEADNFDFIRFKYRILAQVKNSRDFKMYLASVIADSRASEFKKVMADYGLAQIAKMKMTTREAWLCSKKLQRIFLIKIFLRPTRALLFLPPDNLPKPRKH